MNPGGPGPAGRAASATALWHDLLLRLSVPLLLIVAATGGIGLYTAQFLIDRTFDRWLLDAARALAGQVQFKGARAVVVLGGDAEAILSFDVVDSTYFAVRQGERHVAGHADLPSQGNHPTRYEDGQAFDASFRAQPVRVAEVRVGEDTQAATVLVAETLSKRQAVRADLLLMLVPIGLLLVASVAAIMLALQRTLKPLERIAARWNERSHASLQRIELNGVPRELLPFATALNDLLRRIHDLLMRERRFAANAAHQIRTPLAGLQLGLARAASAPDLASARATITELRSSTERTARLLQQLLALGQLDPETEFDLERQPTDLAALAHDVGSLYMDQALAGGQTLELLTPDGAVQALVQPGLVSEALANLVDNALRYAPAGSRVEITAAAHPPSLQVSDSGPGIAPAERLLVLDRFVRGQHASGEGSGLGLAIVKEIVDIHHGELQLDDSPLGGLQVRMSFLEETSAVPSPAP